MSHPSPELILEVNIFERLEQVTSLTLGQLTQLRLQSRSQQINLLFLAFNLRCIDALCAKNIARELGVDVGRAPWNTHSVTGSISNEVFQSGSLSEESRLVTDSQLPSIMASNSGINALDHVNNNPSSVSSQTHSESRVFGKRSKRRFSDRPSLTAAVDQAISLAATPSEHPVASSISLSPSTPPAQRDKKRSFSEIDLKTEVEINLPSSLDQMIQRSPEYHAVQKLTSAPWSDDEIIVDSLEEDSDQNGGYDEVSFQSTSSDQDHDSIHPSTDGSYIAHTSSSSEIVDTKETLDFEPMSLSSEPPRWSQPRWSAMHEHLGVTLYTQLRIDQRLHREVVWVSLAPLVDLSDPDDEEPTLKQQTGTPSRLALSYQQVSKLPAHHALPDIYDVYVDDLTKGSVYYRSQPPGIPLKDVLHTQPPTEIDQAHFNLSAHQILWQLSLQVQLAHQHDIAHLAISPDALWYDQGSIILDRWEWCQSSSSTFTPTSQSSKQHKTTDEHIWIAPELKGDQSATDLLRADVYSLAATVYWLYIGSPPPSDLKETRAVLDKHFQGQHKLLVEGLLSALSPDVQQRPTDAGAFLADCVQHSLNIKTLVDFYRALYNDPLV